MSRLLGEGLVGLKLTGEREFGIDLRRAVDVSVKGVSATVPVRADTKPADAAMDALRAKFAEAARRVAEVTVKANDKEAQLTLLRLNAQLASLGKRIESPRITVQGTARALADIASVDLAVDKLGKGGSGGLGGGLSGGLAGLGDTLGKTSTGFVVLAAAGVALAPVLVTVGAGLAGVGAAAVDVVGPILKAGTATKEQQQALAKLDPAQKAAYDSLGALKEQFHGFSQELEPEVLDLFSKGLGIASHLMADFEPVAKAAGDALSSVLDAVAAEFQSQTWQKFFDFMAASAGPDLKMLGDLFIALLDVLPPFLEQLQPLATALLQVSTAVLKVVGELGKLHLLMPILGAVIGLLVGGPMGALIGAAIGSGVALAGMGGHAEKLTGQIQVAGENVRQVTPAIARFGTSAGDAGSKADQAAASTGKLGDQFKGTWPKAQTYAQWVQQGADATKNLMDNQSAALDKQTAYGNALVTSADNAQALRDALKASSDQVGLHTQKERDSFGAANTYIGSLSDQAKQAYNSGHGEDAAITAIKNGLPLLDSAKTKNKQYWQEVKTLNDWLHQLELQKFINTGIHVTGTGKWSVTGTTVTPGVAHGPQNIGAAPGGFAAGGIIPGRVRGWDGAAAGMYVAAGTGPTADDVYIRASRGELVVPAHMVSGGAVDHLKGWIPGFASGGVAGSYGPGRVAGLPPWTAGRIGDTDRAIAQMTADAALAAMRAAEHAATAAATGAMGGAAGIAGGGVQQWRGLVLQVLKMEGLPASLVNNILYQMQTESGGNPRAINLTDSNAQRGDPSRGLMQTIMSTFLAYHWPGTSFDIYDPLANVAAAVNYARHGRGFGSGPGQVGSGHGYDSGGWLVPGTSVVHNNTGTPEQVTPPGGVTPGERLIIGLLRELIGVGRRPRRRTPRR